MKIHLLLLGISIIFISGCSIIGLGIGIANQENDQFETIYHIELLKEIDPGTKIIVKFTNDEVIRGTFINFEEFYKGGYFNETDTDSVYQKGYWELSMRVKSEDEIYNSNEIKKVEKIFKEGNYAVPIGFGIGLVVDVLLYFLIKSIDFDLGG